MTEKSKGSHERHGRYINSEEGKFQRFRRTTKTLGTLQKDSGNKMNYVRSEETVDRYFRDQLLSVTRVFDKSL